VRPSLAWTNTVAKFVNRSEPEFLVTTKYESCTLRNLDQQESQGAGRLDRRTGPHQADEGEALQANRATRPRVTLEIRFAYISALTIWKRSSKSAATAHCHRSETGDQWRNIGLLVKVLVRFD
jgi:hypothetical protein